MRLTKRILCFALAVCLLLPVFALDAFAATAPSVRPLSEDYDGMKVLKGHEPFVGYEVKKGSGYSEIKVHVNIYKGYKEDGSNITSGNRVAKHEWSPKFASGETIAYDLFSYDISDCGTGTYTQEYYVSYVADGVRRNGKKNYIKFTIIKDSCSAHSWDLPNRVIDSPGDCRTGVLAHTFCTKCGAYYGYMDYPHTFDEDGVVVEEPTCTTPGHVYYWCTTCEDSSEDLTIPPLGHDYVNGVCSRCGAKEPVPLQTPSLELSNVAASGKIKVSWKAIEGATGYEVYRATEKDSKFSKMLTTTKLSYTNTSAVAGRTYYYKVRAINDTEKSSFSKVKYRTCDLSRPIVTVSHVASTGKNKLTWKAVSGAVKYEVWRSTSKTGGYTLKKTTTNLTYTNTDAKAGTTYYYKVLAVAEKSAANSAYSKRHTLTCDLPQPVVTGSHVASTGKNVLSWKAVSGAVGYKVYRSTSKTSGYTLKKTTTNLTYTNTDAKAGTTYYYKVVALGAKSAANSAASAVKTLTCDLPRPTVSITRSSGHPKVTWKAVSGAVSYKVYRAASKTGKYSLKITTTKLSYVNTSAAAGKTYYYKVIAVASRSAANSAYSTPVHITAK